MAQNIYDDAGFFAAYSQLDRSTAGLDGAPEWPALRAMLPPVAGRRVVDLGCGFGWFARWAAAEGAASVLGVDLSARMLARAEAETPAGPVTYRRADLDALTLDPGAFDLAYSSLAIHYLVDLPRFLAVVHQALVPGAPFVFSVEHPVATAPSHPGFVDRPDGTRIWPLDGYHDEGPFTTDWLAPGVVKQHRTMATYLNGLIAAGFTIDRLEEWHPTPAHLQEHPDWSDEVIRPPFLLMAAHRR